MNLNLLMSEAKKKENYVANKIAKALKINLLALDFFLLCSAHIGPKFH